MSLRCAQCFSSIKDGKNSVPGILSLTRFPLNKMPIYRIDIEDSGFGFGCEYGWKEKFPTSQYLHSKRN